MIEMLNAGQRPSLSFSTSNEMSSLIKIHRQPNSGKSKDLSGNRKQIEIYSYCDTMIRDNESWNIKTYDDPYAWLDPPEEIYASNLIPPSTVSSDSQTKEPSSTELPGAEKSLVISTNPYHSRYLSMPQLHWWGLQTAPLPKDHRHPIHLHSRLTQYHDDMLRKQREEKAYNERLRNQQWLQSLHVQQQQQEGRGGGRGGGDRGEVGGQESQNRYNSHSQGKGIRYTHPPRGVDHPYGGQSFFLSLSLSHTHTFSLRFTLLLDSI
jgi:hypothetical protein